MRDSYVYRWKLKPELVRDLQYMPTGSLDLLDLHPTTCNGTCFLTHPSGGGVSIDLQNAEAVVTAPTEQALSLTRDRFNTALASVSDNTGYSLLPIPVQQHTRVQYRRAA